jgi:hypothetical protein
MKYPRWHELNVAYLNTNAVHTAHFVAIRERWISLLLDSLLWKKGNLGGLKSGADLSRRPSLTVGLCWPRRSVV